MARYIGVTTGDFFSTTPWELVTNTPTITPGGTTVLTLTTAASLTATFTAPNITNKCTGVAILISRQLALSATGVITATLQESTVDKVSIAVNLTDCRLGWNYFRFAVPYQFTTVVAGSYRFKIQGSGTSPSYQLATDSGSANAVYLATIDDTSGTPTLGDSTWIMTPNNTGTVTVTVKGTSGTIGAASTVFTARDIVSGCMVGNGGILKYDPTANVTISTRGHIFTTMGGDIQMQPNAGFIHTTTLDQNGVTATVGWGVTSTGGSSETTLSLPLYQAYSGKITTNGRWPTFTKTKYVSGIGTTASKLVVLDAVDWAVNDRIVLAPASNNATNYSESEVKYIKTKTDAFTYTLSDTAGGVEAGFANARIAGSRILHMTRSVVVTTNNAAQYGFTSLGGSFTSLASIQGIEFVNVGSATTAKGAVDTGTTGCLGAVDHCTATNVANFGFSISATAGVQSWSDNFIYDNAGNGSGTTLGSLVCLSPGSSMVDSIAVKASRFLIQCGNGSSWTRCEGIAGNTSGFAGTNEGGFSLQANSITLASCAAHCNRVGGGVQLAGAAKFSITSLVAGSLGYNNASDVGITSSTYNEGTFDSATLSSPTPITNYLNMVVGSEVRFHRYQNTNNKHRWYTNYGESQSTGSGLEDTLVRTPGSLNVRIAPEDLTTGFSWSFQIPAVNNTTVSFQGFFQKNTAFGTSVATISLFLPGSTVADATTTLTNTTGSYLSAAVSAYYAGATDGLATVVVNAKTATASAYLYVADLYNSGDTTTLYDKLAGLTIWYQGKPASLITQINLGGIPSAVWAVATSGLTASGTTGNLLTKLLTLGKFIGLK